MFPINLTKGHSCEADSCNLDCQSPSCKLSRLFVCETCLYPLFIAVSCAKMLEPIKMPCGWHSEPSACKLHWMYLPEVHVLHCVRCGCILNECAVWIRASMCNDRFSMRPPAIYPPPTLRHPHFAPHFTRCHTCTPHLHRPTFYHLPQ